MKAETRREPLGLGHTWMRPVDLACTARCRMLLEMWGRPSAPGPILHILRRRCVVVTIDTLVRTLFQYIALR